MRGFFKNIIFDKTTRLGFFGTFGTVLITFLLIVVYYNKMPPFVPIFNQLPWGEQRLGIKTEIFIPVSIVFLVFVVNLLLSSIIYKKIPLASRILVISSFTFSILAFFFTIRTIQLII
ncbi:MAG: hypothetical protein ACD_50C00284G0007 [uncultured bacterium]|nr:MAG: hypothetical protein ACD_50C00284G0007 [uncultured bacterium]OGH13735.1 MAG: hypothetical protein A2687_03005 [Candidatus Levybacteria bacterium RIFCSPHIGHO2_01_FULL_38_26]